jgi:hypothetical protein
MSMNDDSRGNRKDLPPSRPKTGDSPSVISQVLAQSYGGQNRNADRGKPDQDEETRAAELVPGSDGLAPLPNIGDPYRAYARPADRMLPTLWLLPGDATRRGFPYSGRVGGPDLAESPAGLVIVLRFSDVVPMEVVLAGRNLDELLGHLGYHTIAWVRALPPGKMIADRTMPVVTGITIRTWKPPEDGIA